WNEDSVRIAKTTRKLAVPTAAIVFVIHAYAPAPLAAAPATPAAPAIEEDLPRARLTDAGVNLIKLALPNVESDRENARAAAEAMSKDMDVSDFFQVLDPNSFPQALQAEE